MRDAALLLIGLTGIALLAGAAACRRAEPDPPAAPAALTMDPAAFDGARALEEVSTFVAHCTPRDAGTESAARAARWLAERLAALGAPAVETDEFDDRFPGGTNRYRNVVARFPGAGPGLVILGAHYDTKAGIGGGFEGANDSGSGVGVLLEIARLLAAGPPAPCETWIAFFDGEECVVRYGPHDGLHGSRRMARRLKEEGRARDVRAVIVADMVGDANLNVTVPRNSTPELIAAAFAAARDEGVRPSFSLGPPILDDHAPFLKEGMPAVLLIDFQFGSAPGLNDYWHTPEDRLDKLSAQSLQTVGRVMVRMLGAQTGAARSPRR